MWGKEKPLFPSGWTIHWFSHSGNQYGGACQMASCIPPRDVPEGPHPATELFTRPCAPQLHSQVRRDGISLAVCPSLGGRVGHKRYTAECFCFGETRNTETLQDQIDGPGTPMERVTQLRTTNATFASCVDPSFLLGPGGFL